jgi:hypothetical protein
MWVRQTPALPEIRLSPRTVVIGEVARAGAADDYDVSAPYQRASVWDLDRRRALIMSLVQGIPVGAITVAGLPAAASGPSYRVIDGKQRLETLWAFVADEFSVPADWFDDRKVVIEEVSDDGELLFSALSTVGRRMFQSCSITILEVNSELEWLEVPEGTGTTGANLSWDIRHRTPAEALQFEASVYRLLNTQGVAHSADEIAAAAAVEIGDVS